MNLITAGAPERTTWVAKRMVSGDIVAGELAIAAARRHLGDIEEGRARGLVWRPELAEANIEAYPAYFTITDGPRAGEPFELLDWMAFCSGNIFGWKRIGSDGVERPRFTTAWIETAKGQGKSPWMACTALIAMAGQGRQRAQTYAFGPKEDQARIMMRDAAAAVRSPIPGGEDGETLELRGTFVVRGQGDNAWKIEHPRTRSTFRVLTGKGAKDSGIRPDFAFGDEIHELVDMTSIDMMLAGIAKNSHGGVLTLCTNTPALNQATGTYLSDIAQRVVTGQSPDDSWFSWITRVDVADRATVFDNEACWIKAMPALGVTYPIDNIRAEVARAKANPAEKNRVQRLFFGIPTGAVTFWLDDPTMFDRALRSIALEELRGLKGWLSLDLSSKHDLTSLTGTFEWFDDAGRQHLLNKNWYWTCSANLEIRARRDRMPYDQWAADGFLTVVEGDAITKDYIALFIAGLISELNIDFLTYDVADMHNFEEACVRVGLPTWRYKHDEPSRGQGLKLVPHAQGTRRSFDGKQLSMPTSVEAFEDKLRLGLTEIDDNPVTYACSSNAHFVSDATGNRAFDKKKSRGRIDGIVTLAMGHGAATFVAKAPPRPGIITL